MSNVKAIKSPKVTQEDAEKAVKTLILWAGDNPYREGLRDTPKRVVRSYKEFFAGYDADPDEILNRTFDDLVGYDDFVLVKNIDFVSHCEHHMLPIIGRAHVAYWPDKNVVGISKLGRVVDVFSKRLISQETLTRQIVENIDRVLQPRGTAVMIDAVHHCMSSRGACKTGSSTVTSTFSGIFREDSAVRQRFLDSIKV
jgi:GTP cyclohydrolase IA